MDLGSLMSALSRRAPWLAAGRVILLSCGFDTHRGYEETTKAALKEPANPARDAKLADALQEHLVAGEKLVRVVRLTKAERTAVETWIMAKRKSSSSALVDAFPGVAPDADRRAAATSPPASVGHVALSAGRAALFTSVRSYLDREVISPSQLKAGVADGYEHIYAMRRLYLQTYDAIWLPPSFDVCCLAADLPAGVPSGFARDSQIAMEAELRKVLGRPINASNLWPAVDGLYRSNEGRLVDHGFVNNKEAVKHHTGRRGAQSLRDDEYDKAGAAAVGDDLLTFKVAIAWARAGTTSRKAQPEILLPGKAAMLHVANAHLDHAVIRNCLNTRDLEFVLSRLLPHLT